MHNGIDIVQYRKWNDTGIKFKVICRNKLSWVIGYFDATPHELVSEYDLVMKSKEYNRFEKQSTKVGYMHVGDKIKIKKFNIRK